MNFFLETLRLGLNNLRLHLLRSTLTSLGIILGVAAVILMVAIGEGNKNSAIRDIQALGARNIIIRSQKPPESNSVGTERRSFATKYGLGDFDLSRIRKFVTNAVDIVPVKTVGSEVSFGARRATSQTYGTLPSLQDAINLETQPGGRYLVSQDVEERSRVAVIGNSIADQFSRCTLPLASRFGSIVRSSQSLVF